MPEGPLRRRRRLGQDLTFPGSPSTGSPSAIGLVGVSGLYPPAFPIVGAMQLHHSCLTTSLSAAASSVAATMIAAIAIKPAENEPVQSLSQPIMVGPTKPPNTPMVLMKANPPAAPMPIKNRVGTFQKMARAEVTPTSAMVKPASATSSEPVSSTDATKPTAPRKQATARLATFLPVRSICQAHTIIATEAKRYG